MSSREGHIPAAERPDCFRCRSFFVTHQPDHPYGCRAFGMKTRGLPSIAVLRESGQPCGAFAPKPLPESGSTPTGGPRGWS